ncbi:MAG: hypothetical protein GWN93_09725 [Deltaproteobacteria bacterium]|nr:hypothetical protein [Deltaproteobacteria bacterium]
MTGQYIIVSANSLGNLAKLVDVKLAEGWQLWGDWQRIDKHTFAQTLVKPATIGPSETKVVESGMTAKVISPP